MQKSSHFLGFPSTPASLPSVTLCGDQKPRPWAEYLVEQGQLLMASQSPAPSGLPGADH